MSGKAPTEAVAGAAKAVAAFMAILFAITLPTSSASAQEAEGKSPSFDMVDGSASAALFSDDFDEFKIWDKQSGWNIFGGPQWKSHGRVVDQGTEPYNNELGWYLNPAYKPATVNPFIANGGSLTIRATPYPQKTWFDLFPYTTGMINSYHSFRRTYGYFEMRAKLARGKGFLPAFWLLPVDVTYGEIDAMEVLGNDPTVLYTTVHSYSTGKLVSTGKHTKIPDASKAFHRYGVDWQKDFITWYFDGRQIFWADTPDDLHRPTYMIVNLAVGGSWPGTPDADSAAEIKIDNIRVFKSAAAAGLAPGSARQ